MFAWAKIPEPFSAMGSLELAKHLIQEAKVAVSPGVGFGPTGEGLRPIRPRRKPTENPPSDQGHSYGSRIRLDRERPAHQDTRSDEQLHVCVCGVVEECGRTCDVASFDQVVLGDSHHSHGGGAGEEGDS